MNPAVLSSAYAKVARIIDDVLAGRPEDEEVRALRTIAAELRARSFALGVMVPRPPTTASDAFVAGATVGALATVGLALVSALSRPARARPPTRPPNPPKPPRLPRA